MGSLAVEKPKPGRKLSGVLVKRNFNYHMLSPADVPKYTDMRMTTVTQRQSIHYSGSVPLLKHLFSQIAGTIEAIDEHKIRVFNCIDVNIENKIVTMEVIQFSSLLYIFP